MIAVLSLNRPQRIKAEKSITRENIMLYYALATIALLTCQYCTMDYLCTTQSTELANKFGCTITEKWPHLKDAPYDRYFKYNGTWHQNIESFKKRPEVINEKLSYPLSTPICHLKFITYPGKAKPKKIVKKF